MLLREAADSATRPSGLLGMSISRQVVAGCAELVSVSIWQDMDTMVSVMGPRWREPAGLPLAIGLAPSNRLLGRR